MTQADLLALLNCISFSDRYWAICDRYAPDLSKLVPKALSKQALIEAFQPSGVATNYDSRDRSISIDLGAASGRSWSAVFNASGTGLLEFSLVGRNQSGMIGSNFAVLAYDAKRITDPSYTRDRFSKGPPPYPRPSHNGDLTALSAIIEQFIEIVRDISAALRSEREAEG
jgi:hypothetical protein